MTDTADDGPTSATASPGAANDIRPDGARRPPALAQYGAALALVAVATLAAFVADHLVAAPSLTLIFVIPVVIAATSLGWGPSVVAIIASILAFDFFFTRPYFTLRMTEPSEIWAAGLLLATAAIVSTVAGQSRRRALEARRAADQAQALQALAHAVIAQRSQAEIVQAAASTLSRIFAAPAAILSEMEGGLRTEAVAGDAVITGAETQAAKAALDIGTRIPGETYPNDRSSFDVWPVVAPSARRYVLCVDFKRSVYERPANPERFIEIVGAYIVANLASSGR